MTRKWQFRAHMYCAGGAAVLTTAGVLAHLMVLALINAALFGANAAMAWMARP
jgi:hypothetical protein